MGWPITTNHQCLNHVKSLVDIRDSYAPPSCLLDVGSLARRPGVRGMSEEHRADARCGDHQQQTHSHASSGRGGGCWCHEPASSPRCYDTVFCREICSLLYFFALGCFCICYGGSFMLLQILSDKSACQMSAIARNSAYSSLVRRVFTGWEGAFRSQGSPEIPVKQLLDVDGGLCCARSSP